MTRHLLVANEPTRHCAHESKTKPRIPIAFNSAIWLGPDCVRDFVEPRPRLELERYGARVDA